MAVFRPYLDVFGGKKSVLIFAAQRTYGISLELIDMGTEEGGTFPVHQKMYEGIAGSEIIICDLPGHRPNVYVEAGCALKHHEQNRLIYLFEPQDSGDRVPFDRNTFKYVQISQAAEIQGRLTPEIKAILEDASNIIPPFPSKHLISSSPTSAIAPFTISGGRFLIISMALLLVLRQHRASRPLDFSTRTW